jgi:hypothetical protein
VFCLVTVFPLSDFFIPCDFLCWALPSIFIINCRQLSADLSIAALFPNIEQWLSYSVAMFPSPAQDSILQSIVDFMHHQPHTAESLPGVILSDPLFPQIIVDGKLFQEKAMPPESYAENAIQVVRGRGQPLRIDPNSPVARTTAPAAHALRQEEDCKGSFRSSTEIT